MIKHRSHFYDHESTQCKNWVNIQSGNIAAKTRYKVFRPPATQATPNKNNKIRYAINACLTKLHSKRNENQQYFKRSTGKFLPNFEIAIFCQEQSRVLQYEKIE